MSLNEAMKIGEWSIHDPEKKKIDGFFTSISWDFSETAIGSAASACIILNV